MRAIKIATAIALLLAIQPHVHAANEDFKILEAKKACLTGNAAKGVEILADLYLETRDPVMLFNQGRCFEQNNRYEEAIARFREYLRKATDASAADKADAEKHIAECQAILAAPTAPPVARQEVPAEGIVEAGQGASPTSGSRLRFAGIASAGVGLAALITGAALNLKVNSMIHDLDNHFDRGTYASSNTYKTIAWVSYGVGTACIVSGAVLYAVGWSRAESARLALAPSITSGSASVVLAGVF
jgi:tetratricopeptide (TPR) repeat protein